MSPADLPPPYWSPNRSRWSYQAAIDATHPVEAANGATEIAADLLAMRLVGERHEKRDLVDLVRWLILRRPEGLIEVRD